MAQAGKSETDARNPWDIYRGRQGYDRMLSEIRESLYTQIPEARGSVEIFDHLADPDREIDRIARTFDLTVERLQQEMGYGKYEDFKKALNGKNMSATLPDGRHVSIAAAWDPDDAPGGADDLTFPDIKRYARIIVHETLHGLDPRVRNSQELGPNGWVIGMMANTRSLEMFADVGAQNLMLRNGDTTQSTFNTMANYDAIAAFGAPYSEDLFGGVMTRYDNGPFMQQLLKDYPDGPGMESFRLEGWRETVDKISRMREASPEISIDGMIRNYAQTLSFQSIYRTKIGELETRLEPVKDKLLEQSGFKTLREFSEHYFDQMNFRGWHDGSINRDKLTPEFRTALSATYDAKIELCAWMENNHDLFPDAARVASATRYHLGYSQTHISTAAPSPQELTNDTLMARNWLRFKETGDPFYRDAANDFASSAELAEEHAYQNSGDHGKFEGFDRYRIMTQLFETRPDLVQALAKGIPLRDVVTVNRVNPDNLNDDRYSVASNFDGIIARMNQTPPELNAPAAQPPSLQPPAKP
ncbi:MAG: hypothetical protein KA099_00545 [Alphaproteobacteria bacterium]|nr:hypothetical protein [Alphaproteobacteria bacterium]MBP7757943.1 hypothetical protein [Alphaproteobacteria bacterium]MBP7761270.1 hypothetical protein [Alphaproteobacteria bacterium]MBP7903788.1 hypothetical protein [Alphaproteobacteria bacterium]